jgi:hypothetical protein
LLALSGAAVAPSVGAPARPVVRAAHAPGFVGTPFTVASQVSFDGNTNGWAYSIASDKSGRTYLAWIASSASNSAGREVHLCELPLGATACAGGVQHIALTDPQTSANLRLLVTPGGSVTIIWYHTESGGGEIAEATAPPGGALSSEHDVASAPVNGRLLDAEFGPGGTIWTVVTPESNSPLYVRAGVTNAPMTIAVPHSFASGVGYAQLAFAGSTPIIAASENAGITTPTEYTYKHGGAWTAFKAVPGAETPGINVALTATRFGVRLITDLSDAGYVPVVAKWNGHGFDRAVKTGDTCELGWHDASTDASGRLVDASAPAGCGSRVRVSNFADATHPSTLSFPSGGTIAGGEPQVATEPRGYAWVAWSTQYSNDSSEGDRLRVVEVRLPGVRRSVTKHGKHGTTVLTGPASCFPAVSIAVGVKGHAKHGWKVKSRTVKLGAKKLGKSLDGARLAAGKLYKLKGSVVFSKGHAHSTVTATLAFRACPNP